jgi:tetratricopeptide (TPR) repeat protein
MSRVRNREEAVRTQPDYGPPLGVLGLIDAALGRKEEALREGRRALELAPMAKDSLDGVDVLYVYAVICAWTGERDLAIEQLETLAKIPAGPSYGNIRLDPDWDPLRGDPRRKKWFPSRVDNDNRRHRLCKVRRQNFRRCARRTLHSLPV